MSKYYRAIRKIALYTDIGHGTDDSVVWQYDYGTGLKTLTEAEIFAGIDEEVERTGELPQVYEAGHNAFPYTKNTVARGRIDPDTSRGSIVFEDVPKEWQESAMTALLNETGGAVKFTVFDQDSSGISLQNYFKENF